MQITVTGTDGSLVELTGTRPEEWVEGLSGGLDWALQEVRPIESREVGFRDRGNLTESFGFRISRYFDTPEEAALYNLDHPSSVARIGSVSFTVMGLDGGVKASRTLFSAAVKVERESWQGSRVTMKYRITGGILS